MFGKGFSCIHCNSYAGRLSDGKPMCMKRGPLQDIICCVRFHKKEEKETAENTDPFFKTAGYDCTQCCFFREKEAVTGEISSGECMKFPGRVFRGGKRGGCIFYREEEKQHSAAPRSIV